jgi:hypothetical protein
MSNNSTGYTFPQKDLKGLYEVAPVLRDLYAPTKGLTPSGGLRIDLDDFRNNEGRMILPGGMKGVEFLKDFIKEEPVGELKLGKGIHYYKEYDNRMVVELLEFLGYAPKGRVIDTMRNNEKLIDYGLYGSEDFVRGRFPNVGNHPPVHNNNSNNNDDNHVAYNNVNNNNNNYNNNIAARLTTVQLKRVKNIKNLQKRASTRKTKKERRKEKKERRKTRKANRGLSTINM